MNMALSTEMVLKPTFLLAMVAAAQINRGAAVTRIECQTCPAPSDECPHVVQFCRAGTDENVFNNTRVGQFNLPMPNKDTSNAPSNTRSIHVVFFRNQTLEVEHGQPILIYCPHEGVSLDRPTATNGLPCDVKEYTRNTKSLTIAYCAEHKNCTINFVACAVQSSPCNCYSSPGRCFLFSQLDESRHPGEWICRPNKTGTPILFVNLKFKGDVSATPKSVLGRTGSSSSSSSRQFIVTTTVILPVLLSLLFFDT